MNLIAAHEAIYERLEVIKGVTIWDYLPSDESPPYIVLGKMSFEFLDLLAAKDMTGYVLTQKIHVVTKTQEKHQAIEIINQIKKLLEPELEIEGSFLMKQLLKSGSVEETEDELFYAETNIEIWLEDDEEVQR